VSETEHTPEAHHRMPDLAHQLPGLDPDSVYVVSGTAVLVWWDLRGLGYSHTYGAYVATGTARHMGTTHKIIKRKNGK
jgi:hypothetical protein